MRRDLLDTFQALLDSSGGLGVGLVDRNGLLVHHAGEHDGLNLEALAANITSLQLAPSSQLEPALGDTLREHILLTHRYCLYLHSVNAYALYLITYQHAPSTPARAALHSAKTRLAALLEPARLVTPARHRLEQPRQFPHPCLPR